jgi:hypothetical protein
MALFVSVEHVAAVLDAEELWQYEPMPMSLIGFSIARVAAVQRTSKTPSR